ncbi:MAG TPA: DUF2461 family protein, partial [Bacteroidetes bacterium]|nr:DUF2461 family protein [Bacteroidota bacterium]
RKRELPGYYLAISATELHIGGGLFSLDREGQTLVHNHIKANSQEFLALIREPEFVETFGGIQGDQQRRMSRELEAIRLLIPEIANKTFYYVRGFRVADHLDNENISDLIGKHFQIIAPINAFFRKALGGDEKEELKFGSGYFRLSGASDESE